MQWAVMLYTWLVLWFRRVVAIVVGHHSLSLFAAFVQAGDPFGSSCVVIGTRPVGWVGSLFAV
jgi:hypothetical protein